MSGSQLIGNRTVQVFIQKGHAMRQIFGQI